LLGQLASRSLKFMVVDNLQISEPVQIERLKPREVVIEILHGLGIALGLSLLWVMEVVRDRVFRVLDGANVRPRIRRASAFPPGQPRKHQTRRAQ
jgi:hypothetical protein